MQQTLTLVCKLAPTPEQAAKLEDPRPSSS